MQAGDSCEEHQAAGHQDSLKFVHGKSRWQKSIGALM
jgi:hypothetical protein